MEKKKIELEKPTEIRVAAPLFVPATEGGILASRMKQEETRLSYL